MSRYAVALFLLQALVPALAASPTERWASFEAGYVRTGDIKRCLSLSQIDDVQVIDQQHILFRIGLRRHYLNTLPRPCGELRYHSAISIETSTARLCNIDWVRVLQPFASHAGRVRGSACGLGQFERVERRVAEDEERQAHPSAPDERLGSE